MKLSRITKVLIGGAVITALSFLVELLYTEFNNEVAKYAYIAMRIVGILLVVIAIILLFVGYGKGEKKPLLPKGASYRRKASIMTTPEQKLYKMLTGILDDRYYMVLPQMALIGVIDKTDGGGYRSELFRVADYAIVSARDYAPLLIIELNDSSHNREDRKLRDAKVEAICADAGLPLISFTMAEAANERFVRNELKKVLR